MIVKSYSIADDFTSGVNLPKLSAETSASGAVAGFDGINIDGDVVDVLGYALSDEVVLDALIAAHDTTDLAAEIGAGVQASIDFGNDLLKTYSCQNVLAGFNTVQVKAIADHLSAVQRYIQAGTLAVALDEIKYRTAPLVVDSVELLSQATIDAFAAKIAEHLGVQ